MLMLLLLLLINPLLLLLKLSIRNYEDNNNNADPVSLFLSPSKSIEDNDAVYADDFSYDDEGNESASDILEAFRETGTTTTRAQ